ncbi:MAG: hypothetical protein LIO68_06420 [Rikenellaceae bacterium]|nr:hypothetical protein [Rikenellaceae bacterium]
MNSIFGHTMSSSLPTTNPAWERLSEVIGYSGLSVNAFAKAIGLKRGENLYQIKRGNNGISTKLAGSTGCFPVSRWRG